MMPYDRTIAYLNIWVNLLWKTADGLQSFSWGAVLLAFGFYVFVRAFNRLVTGLIAAFKSLSGITPRQAVIILVAIVSLTTYLVVTAVVLG